MEERYIKKIISLFIVISMFIGFIPASVFASENSKTYTYDNYTVEYAITNSWDNSQNISITIENTGDTLIENWMLSYDFFC